MDEQLRRVLAARLEELATDVGRLRRRFQSHMQTCATCGGDGYADIWTAAEACSRGYDTGDDDACPTCRGRGEINAKAWTGEYVAERMAAAVEDLFNCVTPTAADLAGAISLDDETVDEALAFVDERTRRFRALLDPRPVRR